MSATPGPWTIVAGGGHAYNSIRGADVVQTNGWPEPRGGIANASYSDRVCENLGDLSLPGPAANARLIAAAPDLLEACEDALEFVADQEDTNDGSYGIPEPNKAMRVASMLREAISKATKGTTL